MYTHALADVIAAIFTEVTATRETPGPCELPPFAPDPRAAKGRATERDERIKNIIPIQRPAAAPKRNGRCSRATDAAITATTKTPPVPKFELQSNFTRTTYRGAGADGDCAGTH